MSAYYGSIGDHWFSVVFLFVLYVACVVSVCRMSRRPRVREGSPPDPFSPRGRRDVHGRVRAQHPRRGRALRPGAIPPEHPPFSERFLMPDIDLGPISPHHARIIRFALQIALDSGELRLRQNHDAAVEVDAMLSLRLAQMHEPQRDLSAVPDVDEGDCVAMAAFDPRRGWIDA